MLQDDVIERRGTHSPLFDPTQRHRVLAPYVCLMYTRVYRVVFTATVCVCQSGFMENGRAGNNASVKSLKDNLFH